MTVRSVNLRLERALMGRDMFHINVIETGIVVREAYTANGLHLNSRGKMKLTHLVDESMHGGHVASGNSITHARASPFLG
jgi:hypothetical protein